MLSNNNLCWRVLEFYFWNFILYDLTSCNREVFIMRLSIKLMICRHVPNIFLFKKVSLMWLWVLLEDNQTCHLYWVSLGPYAHIGLASSFQLWKITMKKRHSKKLSTSIMNRKISIFDRFKRIQEIDLCLRKLQNCIFWTG